MSLVKQPAARAVTRWISTSCRTAGSVVTATTVRRLASPWTCPDCRIQVQRGRARDGLKGVEWRRHFSNIRSLRDEARKPVERTNTTPPATSTDTETPASTSTSLPSHTESQRSQTSKRMSRFIDDLLARASIAGQHINAYTGTDYSGIEALRREILDQERKARKFHIAVDEAKSQHHEAHAKQTSAQREIVALLERKSSWSPEDLERYMSLVRSEHLNDQDVQVARDNLSVAERNLEDARSLMERLERKQYHEEQIWSDTIRRNSTWVTFGLMGVNILLLLAQIAVFEPYRRKKIVRDVKNALDEKTLPAVAAPLAMQLKDDDDVTSRQEVVRAEVNVDDGPPPGTISPLQPTVGESPLAAGEGLPPEATTIASAKAIREGELVEAENTLNHYRKAFLDLFSDRLVQLRKIDVTITTLQGAATGAFILGSVMYVLLRPR